jgi:spermidine synthase
VELEPAVREAGSLFAEHNGHVLDDPRVRVWIADGRNFLLTTPRQYDVIVSEPSNPWIGGLASLFTTEMFQAARARLRPDGIMVQWLQGYTLDGEDLRMIVRTFASVFPGATLWASTRDDFLLVGRTDPGAVDLPTIKARFERNADAARDLRRANVKVWTQVMGSLILGAADFRRLAGEGPLNTDDRLTLEFSAPRALYHDTIDLNWQLIAAARRAELPEFTPGSRGLLDEIGTRYDLGLELARRNFRVLALAQFDRVLAADPRHAPALVAASATSLLLGQSHKALELASRAIKVEPRNAQAFYLAGIATARTTPGNRATPFFERAAALAPADPAIQRALARSRGWDLQAWSWIGTGGDEPDFAQIFER